MAVLRNDLLLSYCLVAFLSVTASFQVENFVRQFDPCAEVCEKTYTFFNHKGLLGGECCKRGCRFYSIGELIGSEDGINGTMKSCYDDCKNAYPGEREDTSACILGCRSQKPFINRKEQLTDVDFSITDMDMSRMLYPLLFMHNMYSDIVGQATNQMCVSWSFFFQDGDGKMVMIKSKPQTLNMDVQDFDDYSTFRGTSSGFETNIEPAGHTATEVLRHSQLKSGRSFADEINAAEADPWKYKLDDGSSSDWLTCIARKTGLPRLLLCIIILLSAVAMIWLCMSAAVTAPDQKLSQKLSIQGDLEYLRYLPDKKGILGVHPQDFVQARPLPVKIRVEQI